MIGTVLAAATIGIVDTADELLTKGPPPVLLERAEITGGAWGPSRLLYRCMPGGQCMAPDRVMLDSMANDPVVGNEATFMSAKVLGSRNPLQNKVDVKIGDTVLVRAFIANDAAMHIADGRSSVAHRQSLVAHDTRFNLILPTNSSGELPLIGHISASNATPKRIYDALFLRSNKRFAIEYAWRSAELSNHMHNGLPLSDDIVGEGALVGSNGPDGTLPPGLSNGAAVFLLVHIVPPAT